mmetsp:Transcript_38453/g.84495  ORF Transcript_38453/g.84495 Transcript_38453/m.84495 type:complete len:329 (+) Transcript_38453:326-1312(+)
MGLTRPRRRGKESLPKWRSKVCPHSRLIYADMARVRWERRKTSVQMRLRVTSSLPRRHTACAHRTWLLGIRWAALSLCSLPRSTRSVCRTGRRRCYRRASSKTWTSRSARPPPSFRRTEARALSGSRKHAAASSAAGRSAVPRCCRGTRRPGVRRLRASTLGGKAEFARFPTARAGGRTSTLSRCGSPGITCSRQATARVRGRCSLRTRPTQGANFTSRCTCGLRVRRGRSASGRVMAASRTCVVVCRTRAFDSLKTLATRFTTRHALSSCMHSAASLLTPPLRRVRPTQHGKMRSWQIAIRTAIMHAGSGLALGKCAVALACGVSCG